MNLTTHLLLVSRLRMHGAIPPLPNTPSWRGAQLKHRDNFTYAHVYLLEVFQQKIWTYSLPPPPSACCSNFSDASRVERTESRGCVVPAHHLLQRVWHMNKYPCLSRTPGQRGRRSSWGQRLEYTQLPSCYFASLVRPRASLFVLRFAYITSRES
jgi:hypothetical protein